MLLSTLLESIKSEPALYSLDYRIIIQFIDLAQLLRAQISYTQPYYITTPPAHLPINIHEFLWTSLNIPDETTKNAWAVLNTLVWEEDPAQPQYTLELLPLFLQFGLSRQISFIPLYPPPLVHV
ncbi:hypothetical protein QCA50_006369 [Cerrena zonata]|uniref:Uncharacterized protein n=1 Tax=Cerrena zonata TaxID=2478898 RepID=A0AAW0G8G1_9APHY